MSPTPNPHQSPTEAGGHELIEHLGYEVAAMRDLVVRWKSLQAAQESPT